MLVPARVQNEVTFTFTYLLMVVYTLALLGLKVKQLWYAQIFTNHVNLGREEYTSW